MSDELAVIQRAYDLTAWAVPAIAKFPRSHRATGPEEFEGGTFLAQSRGGAERK